MTTDPVFAALTKASATQLQQSYGHLFVLPSQSDQVALQVSGNTNPSVVLGTILGSGIISLGSGSGSPDVALARTGTATATFTGVLTLTSPAIATPSITGSVVFTLAIAAGTIAVKVSGNAANSVVLGTIASSGTISFGDGTNAPDVAIARTGSGALTLTGTITMTSPAITTPTGIVKGDVGLGNVTNTSDANKPVSTAQQTALDLKANLASPTFTGTAVFPLGQIFLSDATHLVQVWDATTTNGRITLGTGNVGVPVGSINIFADTAHTVPVVALLNVNGTPSVALGPGGSTAADFIFARTGTAAGSITGQLTIATGLTFGSGISVVLNSTTGTKIGTATSQKLGFWNATAIIQPASASQAAVGTTAPAGGTGAAAGGWDTSGHRDTAIATINSCVTLVNQLRSDLVSAGLIKGSA